MISCKINVILNWSANCFTVPNAIDSQVGIFSITDAMFYVAVVTLSTQNNIKLLDQLKSGFKMLEFNWNEYQSKTTIQTQNQK